MKCLCGAELPERNALVLNLVRKGGCLGATAHCDKCYPGVKLLPKKPTKSKPRAPIGE